MVEEDQEGVFEDISDEEDGGETEVRSLSLLTMGLQQYKREYKIREFEEMRRWMEAVEEYLTPVRKEKLHEHAVNKPTQRKGGDKGKLVLRSRE